MRAKNGAIRFLLLTAPRRLVSALPALFGVLLVTFVLVRVLPGDPAAHFAASPSARSGGIWGSTVLCRRSSSPISAISRAAISAAP